MTMMGRENEGENTTGPPWVIREGGHAWETCCSAVFRRTNLKVIPRRGVCTTWHTGAEEVQCEKNREWLTTDTSPIMENTAKRDQSLHSGCCHCNPMRHHLIPAPKLPQGKRGMPWKRQGRVLVFQKVSPDGSISFCHRLLLVGPLPNSLPHQRGQLKGPLTLFLWEVNSQQMKS